MKKILFVCLGNICRSPMAEYLLKDMVRRQGLAAQFQIASAATSREPLPAHHFLEQILRHGAAADVAVADK